MFIAFNYLKILLVVLLLFLANISNSFAEPYAECGSAGDEPCDSTEACIDGYCTPNAGTTTCNSDDDCSGLSSGGRGSYYCADDGICKINLNGGGGTVTYGGGNWIAPSYTVKEEQLKNGEIELGSTASSIMLNTAQTFNIGMFGASNHGDPVETGYSGQNNGLIGFVGGQVANLMVNKPVSSVEYIADIGRNAGFNIAKPVYAQGMGYQALTPVLEIWKAFRNIAYVGFVLIFVVVGFMIMFRRQMGQAAVTIQTALPQIIVTLLLVTFSYAIASFMIDLIYVLIYVIIGIFVSSGLITDGGEGARTIFFGNTAGGELRSFFSIFLGFFETTLQAGAVIEDITNDLFGMGPVTEALASLSIAPIAAILGMLVIGIMIMIAVFKVFLRLLKAYITIIFHVIFSPFILLMNAFPGSTSFVGWIKGIAANAALFPVTAILLLIGNILLGNHVLGTASEASHAFAHDDPDLMLPIIFHGLSTEGIKGIVGIGFILMMPTILETVYKKLGAEEGGAGQMGGAMTGAIGAMGGALGASAVTQVGGRAFNAGMGALASRKGIKENQIKQDKLRKEQQQKLARQKALEDEMAKTRSSRAASSHSGGMHLHDPQITKPADPRAKTTDKGNPKPKK